MKIVDRIALNLAGRLMNFVGQRAAKRGDMHTAAHLETALRNGHPRECEEGPGCHTEARFRIEVEKVRQQERLTRVNPVP